MASVPAKAGTPIDPWSSGIMALGGIAQAAMQPGGPSSSSGNNYSSSYDGSAWSVSVGSAGANAATNAKSESPGVIGGGSGTAGALGGLLNNPLLLIGLAAAFVLLRK